ncbi:Transcription-silencing protein Clr2 [Penicillium coprophilum]|uniref:Transcription-silencing protein Clr2 n=1 Tax=Penicillium coprophilum TaxID=36646 RepID=UPI00238BCD8C|nr:Transcription-silencing protein Clr2 [Penicillium coprophilum]KAJ5170221.1 Transcription-silencing protein Clr2 [Penicillium coprophilum]
MPSSSEDEDSNINVIPMENFVSDGDMSTWPGNNYSERSDARWRELLAENWLKAMGTFEEGVIHTIEKLPDGYCLFERPRGTNPSMFDPFLFGHPSGRYFQSQITFLPHFLSLVKNELDKCKCKLCAPIKTTQGTSVPGKSVQRTKRPMQPIVNERRPTDAEGPDYWRILVMKLKDKQKLDEDIEQRFNLDWVLTHEWLSDYFTKLKMDPAYVPRRGELVLWIWQGLEDGCLLLNPKTRFIEIFGNDNKWHGVPNWRAGVVTQTPKEEEHMVNIIETPDSPRGLSYSGFRVETLPDPLGNDKSYSVQYAYVPLRNIKPFNTWQAYLNGQKREETHPSIENALTVMSSWSMVHKFHVIGEWPNARIQCKGIFIGAELLAVHDTVRLRPYGFHHDQLRNGTVGEVTEVMVIEKIQLCLSGCTDNDQDQLAEHFTALISGKVFTTDPSRISQEGPFKATLPVPSTEAATEPIPLTAEEATATFRQVSMSDYGPWYRMANGKTCNVSPHLIIGRCYEPLAAELMFGTHTLGYDLSGVMEGRAYSSQVDTRMAKNNTWFWGDCRVETLGLTEINGVECGLTAAQREDPQKWQAIIRISHGEVSHALRRQAQIPSSSGRPFKSSSSSSAPRGRPKTGLAHVAQNSKLVSSAIGSAPETEDDSSDDTNGPTDDQVSGGVSGLGLRGGPSSGEDSAEDSPFA